MKKHILMIAAALLLGTLSYGQAAGPRGGAVQFKNGNKGPQGPGGRMMGGGSKRIMDQLNLTAAQKTQIEKLYKAQGEKMKAMRDKATATGKQPDREQWRAQAKAMRDQHMASLKKILTAAQYKKFEQLMAAERAKMEKMRANGGGRPGQGGAAAKATKTKNGGR